MANKSNYFPRRSSHFKNYEIILSGRGSLDDIETEAGEFVNLVRADVKDGRAVRRTVSIPKWMDERVSETGLSLSRVLQDALQQRL